MNGFTIDYFIILAPIKNGTVWHGKQTAGRVPATTGGSTAPTAGTFGSCRAGSLLLHFTRYGFVYGYKIQRFNHSKIQGFPAGLAVGAMHKTILRAV
jgi:hypothetical protein